MVELLAQFRNQLYEKLHLYKWADCGMGLIDALASAQGVRSVVELSLQPAFRNRHPSGLFKAIRFFPLSGQEMMATLRPLPPAPSASDLSGFWRWIPSPPPTLRRVPGGPGATSTPPTRPLARSPLPSGIPAPFWPSCLSGKTSSLDPPWAVFLDAQRVATSQNAAQVGQRPIVRWLQIQAQANPSWRADQTPGRRRQPLQHTGLYLSPGDGSRNEWAGSAVQQAGGLRPSSGGSRLPARPSPLVWPAVSAGRPGERAEAG